MLVASDKRRTWLITRTQRLGLDNYHLSLPATAGRRAAHRHRKIGPRSTHHPVSDTVQVFATR
jgi:hypothetical protein